jgi:hypothetical protein
LLEDVATVISSVIPFDGWCGSTLDPVTWLKQAG